MSPSPTPDHQRISGRLFIALRSHVARHVLGEVFYAPADVLLSDFDAVAPDLLFVSKIAKRKLFERADVRKYWIVDPELEVVKGYRRRPDGTFPRIASWRVSRATRSPHRYPG